MCAVAWRLAEPLLRGTALGRGDAPVGARRGLGEDEGTLGEESSPASSSNRRVDIFFSHLVSHITVKRFYNYPRFSATALCAG